MYAINNFLVVNVRYTWIFLFGSTILLNHLFSHMVLFCISFILKQRCPYSLWSWLFSLLESMLWFYMLGEGMWLVNGLLPLGFFFHLFLVVGMWLLQVSPASFQVFNDFWNNFSFSLMISEIIFIISSCIDNLPF